MLSGGIARSKGGSDLIFRHSRSVFHSGGASLHSHHILANAIFHLFDNSHSTRYEVRALYGLNLHLPDDE